MADLARAAWRKSSFSTASGNCVEAAPLATGQVGVRNSKAPQAGTLKLDRAETAAWLRGLKAGEYDDLG